MQTAAALFDHADTCRVRGDRIMPADGPFYEPFPVPNSRRLQRRRRRRHLLDDAQALSTAGELDAPAWPLAESEADARAGRALQQMQPEFGTQRDRVLYTRAQTIKQAQVLNLQKSGWLGEYEPMLATCPLTARKVSPEAVSEFASIAWRCDGLGFAWECLQHEAAGHIVGDAQQRGEPGVHSAAQ
jgi:hypothetical protein